MLHFFLLVSCLFVTFLLCVTHSVQMLLLRRLSALHGFLLTPSALMLRLLVFVSLLIENNLFLMLIVLLQQLLIIVNLEVCGCRLCFLHFILNLQQVNFEFLDKLADSLLICSFDVCDFSFVLLLQFKALLFYPQVGVAFLLEFFREQVFHFFYFFVVITLKFLSR